MAEPEESLPAAPAIGAMLQDLGLRIRSLRKERNLTLERLGELSDLSVGIVSQIERGKGNPSFATLAQLAHGLDIPVGRLLYVSEQNKSPVVRRGERRRLDGHGLGYDDGGHYELLTPDFTGALEVVWVEHSPGYDTAATPYRHNGEEFGLVIEGRARRPSRRGRPRPGPRRLDPVRLHGSALVQQPRPGDLPGDLGHHAPHLVTLGRPRVVRSRT